MMHRWTALKWSASAVVLLLMPGICRAEQPSQAAVAGFDRYTEALEARLAAQRRQNSDFIALPAPAIQNEARLRRGDLIIENLTPANVNLPGAYLYHWRGTAFVPGATAAEFERLMRNFPAYPRIYSPQVVSAKVLSQNGNRYQVTMRVKQKHVITVVMDTTYDVEFGRIDARHGWEQLAQRGYRRDRKWTRSQSRRRARLSVATQHLLDFRAVRRRPIYVQIESVSLTRSIPTGLGWAIGPFVQSVPRDSLEFTLRATRDALR